MDRIALLNFFPRRATLPADLAEALADLDRLGRERPELAGPVLTLAPVLRAAFGTAREEAVPKLDGGAVRRAWDDGLPWFRVEPPEPDRAALRDRGLAICQALRADNPAAAPLRTAIRRGRADLSAWAREALAGRPEGVTRQARDLGLDPGLAASVLRLALLPALARWSAALGALRAGPGWPHGDCPHCGSRPLLAEARGLEQAHVLRCGLCAAGWPTRRLLCPHCGEADHRALSVSFVEGDEARHRLSRCATCGDHLKIVSTLAPLSAPALVVADLATAHLDLIPDG